MLHTEARN